MFLRHLSGLAASGSHFPMKTHRTLIASFIACLFTLAAFAADASPTGTWKWSTQGRGGQSFESTVKLDYKDGKLTGTMLGRKVGEFDIPDTEISDASVKDGTIKFAVVREFNGNKFTTKYEGKLDGDTIKGSYERPGMNGGDPVKTDWNAKRSK